MVSPPSKWVARLKSRTSFLVVRRILPAVLQVGRTFTPSRNHVFLTGFPPTEGNAVETVRALCKAYPGKVVWAEAPSRAYMAAVGLPDTGRIRTVRKASPIALWKYVTAEAVFFTHGLYGEPPTSQRKPIINLWHGAGIKPTRTTFFPDRKMSAPAAGYVVGGTRLWGEYCASVSGLQPDAVILSGYPRFDQMAIPCSAGQLEGLGVDPDRPFVFWMPSYRTAKSLGTMRPHRDSGAVDIDEALAKSISSGIRILSFSGIQTVVKPHPFDPMARRVPEAILIDDEALEKKGIPLYSLLGAASGLITDMSSVMADYLKLDRPIGFFFPDREAYEAGRGIYPHDALEWLPGPFLDDPEDFRRFAQDIHEEGAFTRGLRRRTMDRAGVLSFDSSAMQMLRILKEKDSSKFAKSLVLADPPISVLATSDHLPTAPGSPNRMG